MDAAFTRQITHSTFSAFFDSLVDAAGAHLTPEQVKDTKDRWWRWSCEKPEYVIRYSFTKLLEKVASESGIVRFPGVADLKREAEVVTADLAKKKKKMEEIERERESRCKTCDGMGVVNLVHYDGQTYTLEFYACMKNEDGSPVSGGALMELACVCPVGERRTLLPKFSVGILSPESPAPGDPGPHVVKKVSPGWAVKAVKIASQLRAQGAKRADVMAAMLRLSFAS